MKTAMYPPSAVDGRRHDRMSNLIFPLCCLSLLLGNIWAADQKTGSVFFPEPTRIRMRENALKTTWGETVRQAVLESAQPWRVMSDENLWDLMFGPTITRSWMVWSDGFCPACRAVAIQ